MTNTSQRSTAVIASGVIAILGSVVTAIGVLMGLMGVLVAPRIPRAAPGMPDPLAILVVMIIVFFAVAIWGAFSGVGLIRFRNWARVSTLIWAGITAPFSLLVIGFMAILPFPVPPNSPAPITAIRSLMILFYGAPFAIAVWWLILFTRPKIVEQFRPAAASGPGDPFGAIPVTAALDASGMPIAGAVPALMGPSVPIPIIVLACFFLLSSLSIFFIFFVHVPAMVFGRAFTGLTGSVVYAMWCALYVIAGVGMLKRISWAYSVAIGVQILGIVSGIITLLSANFEDMMRRAMFSMQMSTEEVYTMQSMAHLRGFSFIGLLFPLAILGILVYYRPRFLAACALKAGNPPAPGDSMTPGDSPSQTASRGVEPVA